MDINVSCEKCGDALEIDREWSSRDGIEVTVMPCGCNTMDEDLLEKFANLCREYPGEPPLALLELALPGRGGESKNG